MKAPLLSLAVAATLLAAGGLSAASDASPRFPGHVIDGSELRVLPPTATGRHYQLHVGLPASYATNSQKRYPVVYVTDGYWDFQKITSAEGSLVWDKVVPEFITVGIGYAGKNLNYGELRAWELSPVPFGRSPSDLTPDNTRSGHAAEFLRSIETEIIPFIEREYRADPSYRVMAGASLGGLFTLYAMYTRPELFKAYIAATPAVAVGQDWLLGYEAKFAASRHTLPVRLFVSVGGNEAAGFVSSILRLNQRIASRKYEGLAYQFRIIDDERHAGMQQESYSRGLRFAFLPLGPESGPMPEMW